MIQKEIGEIKKRLTPDKNCINKIYGCFVNNKKEIISGIECSMALLPLTETEKYLALFKKTLSGTIGKNLIDIEFSTHQVTDGDEHKLLMKLRDSDLNDTEAREQLFKTVIDAVNMEDKSYVILLALDKYDVPFMPKEDEALDGMESESDTVFKYFVCTVCPVNEGKTELGYFAKEKEFHSCTSPQIIAAPEIGFMFPAFDDRASNIYKATMYSRNTAILQQEFIDALFKTEPPMSAPEQKEAFGNALAESLEKECSFEVMQAVHEQILERIEEHKESKKREPLELGTSDVATILRTSGVPEEKVEDFKKKCEESFSKADSLNPNNIIDAKKFEVTTPQVKISVDPTYSYAIETKIIDGRKYILIPAGDGVSVNGVEVNIPEE